MDIMNNKKYACISSVIVKEDSFDFERAKNNLMDIYSSSVVESDFFVLKENIKEFTANMITDSGTILVFHIMDNTYNLMLPSRISKMSEIENYIKTQEESISFEELIELYDSGH